MSKWRRLIAVAAMAFAFAASGIAAAQQVPAAPPLAAVFAPPLGKPLAYRVTLRRLGRDGRLISFTLQYVLLWQRIGRGYGLDATLRHIVSDAPPSVRRAMTGLLEPLVDLPVHYLVAADGSRIDLVDADALWKRIAPGAAELGRTHPRPTDMDMAAVLLALPLDARNELLSADIKALIVPANPAIPALGVTDEVDSKLTMRRQGNRVILTKSESDVVMAGGGQAGGQPLSTVSKWTIDSQSGIVIASTIQNWVKGPDMAAPALVEERARVLAPSPF